MPIAAGSSHANDKQLRWFMDWLQIATEGAPVAPVGVKQSGHQIKQVDLVASGYGQCGRNGKAVNDSACGIELNRPGALRDVARQIQDSRRLRVREVFQGSDNLRLLGAEMQV